MIRVLFFFLLLFAVTMGFAWMADLPGVISISWEGYVWEQPPVIAAVLIGLAFVLIIMLGWLVLTILRSPAIASRFFSRRRRQKGYDALSNGLIALGSGDIKRARRMGLDADRYLSDVPATKLLLAQTAQLAGRDAEARERFEDMLQEEDTKLLGLHGLFIEAERQGEPVAALHYAEEAVKAKPDLEWAGKAVLGYQAVASHWEEALQTLQQNYSAKLLDKKTYRRHRAVILTALAEKLEDGEPDRAFSLAKEAHGLANDLVPAALVASRLATRRGEIRKASKFLEVTWRLSPHPELAEAYAHVRSGDSARDRLKRMKYLKSQRSDTIYGPLALARAALDAREFELCRSELKELLNKEPVREAFLLMAEVEEAEHGDRGRMRDWLARAVNAPMDKAWIADGVVSKDWKAVSPVTGRLDAFEWKTPQDGQDADQSALTVEDELFDAPPALTGGGSSDDGSGEPETETVILDDVEDAIVEVTPVKAQAPEPAASAKPKAPESEKTQPAAPVAKKSAETKPPEPAKAAEPAKPKAAEPVKAASTAAAAKAAPVAAAESKSAKSGSETAESVKPESADTKTANKAVEAKKSQPDTPQPKTPQPKTSEAIRPEGSAVMRPVPDAADDLDDDDDLGKPIALPFGRMPDDPGAPEDEDDQPPKPRLFN